MCQFKEQVQGYCGPPQLGVLSKKNSQRKGYKLDYLVLSTGLIMWIGHRKEIRKRTFWGLTLETSASESLYGGQFTLSTQLIQPNYLVILILRPYPPPPNPTSRRSTTVSLETYPLYKLDYLINVVSLQFYLILRTNISQYWFQLPGVNSRRFLSKGNTLQHSHCTFTNAIPYSISRQTNRYEQYA